MFQQAEEISYEVKLPIAYSEMRNASALRKQVLSVEEVDEK